MKAFGKMENGYGLGNFNDQSFVTKFNVFDGQLISGGVQRWPFHLAWPGSFHLPDHNKFVVLIEKADREIPRFNAIFLDGGEPFEKFIVGTEHSPV